MNTDGLKCRCGWNGKKEHPCHGMTYTCRKPGTERFVRTNACLSGTQTKFGVYITYACDLCWESYLATVGEGTTK